MPLDFRKNTPPPLISPREQVRILILLGMMVLVLIAMRVAGRPGSWEWLWDRQPSAQPANEGAPEAVVTVAQAVAPSQEVSDDSESGRFEVPSAESPDTAGEAPEFDAATQPPEAPPGPVGLDLSRLAVVRDNTRLSMRGNEEAEPYYYVLDFASRIEPAELEALARRDLTFAQFLDSPGDYRGELVHLQGAVKRLIRYEAGPNDYGLDQLYEAWLFTEDSYNNPYVIVCTRIPEGMPMGDAISERVRVAGFFFKNNAYSAADAPRIAPMILAQRLVWIRPAAASGGPTPLKVLAGLIAVGSVAAVVVFLWLRRRTPSPADRLAAGSPASMEALDQAQAAPQPEQFLDQLSREGAERHDEAD